MECEDLVTSRDLKTERNGKNSTMWNTNQTWLQRRRRFDVFSTDVSPSAHGEFLGAPPSYPLEHIK